MGRVVVCGAGMIGLAAAMMLVRDGHEVVVLEADPDAAPTDAEQAWSGWRRRGVAQFHQPHNLFALFRAVCDDELPDVTAALVAAGCVGIDPLAAAPPTLADRAPRPGDERLRFVTGRRPVFEAALARLAESEPGLTVRRGVKVAALCAGPPASAGIPHIAGVVTTDGDTVAADLVVDATGRRTPSAAWLRAVGAREPAVEAKDSGFAYYTRFFTGPSLPPVRARPLSPMGSVSLLTLPGDNRTWSVTVFGGSGDAPLKALRDTDVFTRVVAACPLQAHWLDGQAITEVLPMAGVLDVHRRFVLDGEPVATGLLAVGDAWACTNPSAGRGLSIGMRHAQVLRHAVRAALDKPAELARLFDEGTRESVQPLHDDQMAADRVRLAEMAAAREGTPPPAANPTATAFAAATAFDPAAFRGFLDVLQCLATMSEVLARPEIQAAIDQHRATRPSAVPGPDRGGLEALLAG